MEGARAMRQRTKGVDSARRALQILLTFSHNRPELTIEDIVNAADISLPSAYRYVALLREMYLIEERSKGTYVLSPEILQLARAAELTMDYRAEAEPVLAALREQTGETSLYVRRLNDAAVCLAIAESDHAISISFQPGHVMPLHKGAGAKVLLSGLPKAKRAKYFAALEPPLSAQTLEALNADLDGIRVSGFAVSMGEVDEGVWACAAEVKSRGHLVGAVSVVAPSYRLTDAKQAEIGSAVRAAARDLGAAIGDDR